MNLFFFKFKFIFDNKIDIITIRFTVNSEYFLNIVYYKINVNFNHNWLDLLIKLIKLIIISTVLYLINKIWTNHVI
jgi:hypothetical protein